MKYGAPDKSRELLIVRNSSISLGTSLADMLNGVETLAGIGTLDAKVRQGRRVRIGGRTAKFCQSM